jgi:hypothetical protein
MWIDGWTETQTMAPQRVDRRMDKNTDNGTMACGLGIGAHLSRQQRTGARTGGRWTDARTPAQTGGRRIDTWNSGRRTDARTGARIGGIRIDTWKHTPNGDEARSSVLLCPTASAVSLSERASAGCGCAGKSERVAGGPGRLPAGATSDAAVAGDAGGMVAAQHADRVRPAEPSRTDRRLD